MSGTKIGGKKSAAKNIANNPNFYAEIGAIGGKNGHTGGFGTYTLCDGSCGLIDVLGTVHTKAQCAGYKGGKTKKRIVK